MKILAVFLSLLSALWLKRAEATATLEITLTSFNNPGGKDINGDRCDVIGDCDHKFYFGLDQLSGDKNDARKGSIMVKVTGEFSNSNSNSFQTNAFIKNVYNPISQTFSTWPGGVLFKVYIEDVDVDSPDHVDQIIYTMMFTPSRQKDASRPMPLTLQGMRTRTSPTSLSLSVRVYCDMNYFGADCSVYCEPKNNDYGHYTCDPDTGAIICRPKWEDVTTQCTIFSDDCEGSRCQNGAICVDGVRNYTCTCIPGYTGRFCEININECTPNICANGAECTDFVNDFSCKCHSNFVGKTCNATACSLHNPCLNGGTCYGELNCYCPRGFTGPFCATAACQIIPCANSGVCGPDGLCICPEGTLGDQCEVLVCDVMSSHCKNGASCYKGKCKCPLGFEGLLCEQNNWCKGVTCQHNGTCVTELGANGWSTRCLCASNFTGERCEIYYAKEEAPKESLVIPPDNFGFLGTTEGKIMLSFIILSVILLIIVIILSMCLCFKRDVSKTKSTRVESHEVSIISSNPTSTVSSLPPKFPDSPALTRSPPPKYTDDHDRSKYANHYVVDERAAGSGSSGSSGLGSCGGSVGGLASVGEESPYATLDENEVFAKVKDENEDFAKVKDENESNWIVDGGKRHLEGVNAVDEIQVIDGFIKPDQTC